MPRIWISLGSLGLVFVLAWLIGSLLVDESAISMPSVATDASAPGAVAGSLEARAKSARFEFEAMVRARTIALEQLADQCTPTRWGQAESVRDRASEAQERGDAEDARLGYDTARRLYSELGADAAVQLARGGCSRASEPILELPSTDASAIEASAGDPGIYAPSNAYGATANDLTSAPTGAYDPYDANDSYADELPDSQGRASEMSTGERFRAAVASRPVADGDEVALRAEASGLVESQRACEAVRLLEGRGRSRRSRELARALRPTCRAERRSQ